MALDSFSQLPSSNEKQKDKDISISDMSDERLVMYVELFLGQKVDELEQEQVNLRLKNLLSELSERNIKGFGLLSSALPSTVSGEDIQNGDSAAAKVYKALFKLGRANEYKSNPQLQMLARELENSVDQNPQMIGPVAMWQIAKDNMWRKDVPVHMKGSLMGSMTYALAFMQTEEYKTELLKQLDFENIENYSETAHLLEAIKNFWEVGHQSYSEDRGVPNFFVEILSSIQENDNSNYLLSLRAREIVDLLSNSRDFINESIELMPFEVSRSQYAYNTPEGTRLIPNSKSDRIREIKSKYKELEKEIKPPQWMISEAIENGEEYITWEPKQDLILERRSMLQEVYELATEPIVNVFDDNEAEQIFDYEFLLSRPMRTIVQEEFGFELKSLTIQEQFYFLDYLKGTTIGNAEIVQKFVNNYGTNGLRTFLALDKLGNDFGDTIVNFGNQQAELSAEYFAEVVFGHFNDLIDSVNGTEQYISEQFSKSVDKETLREVIDGVKVRAAYFLHDLLNQPLGNSSDTWKRIGEALERAKVDAVLFTSTFRILKERDELNLEDIKDTTFETVSSEELAQDRKATERMEAILRKNYESYPPEFRAQILNGMKGAFGRNETHWYLLRHKDEVVGFNRFDERRDTDGNLEELYFGSFNVDSSFGNGKLGEAVFEASFKKEMEHGVPIHANCDPEAQITQKYISAGFVADSYEDISGVPSFSILLDSSTNEKLKTKQLSKEEIMQRAKDNTKTEATVFTVSDDVPDFTRLKSGGWVLTQYFSQGGRYYSVFEKFSS